MKIVFVGYRSWSYQILKNLLKRKSNKWQIVSVLTSLKPETNFKNLGLPCYSFEPKTFGNTKITEILKRHNPDVFLFYGWSWIIPKELFEKYLSLILHPSPLPKYRGGSPLQNQIINGEKESAVTLFKGNEKIDSGPIYSQSSFSLDGTIQDIFDRIVKIGTKDTLKVLHGLSNNSIKPTEQNENEATFFKRRKPEESELTIKDFQEKTAEELYNFIRALSDPYPNAYILCRNGKKLLLKKAALEHK